MKLIIDIPEKEYQYIINEGFLERTHGKMCYKAIKKAIHIPDNKPKTGHWIEKDGFDGDTYYDCSECGESWTTIEGTPWQNGMKYCPNCGARMESEDKG